MEKILLICDLQKGFSSQELATIVDKAAEDFDLVFQTKFIRGNPLFLSRLGWEGLSGEEGDLWLTKYPVWEKTGYGLPRDLLSLLISKKPDSIVLAGGDLDACVLAAAFDLWDEGILPVFEPPLLSLGNPGAWDIIFRQFGGSGKPNAL